MTMVGSVRRYEPMIEAARWSQAGDDDADCAVIKASLQEPERFTAIFDRHAQDLHRYVAARLGSEAADDLVSETFLIAFRKRDTFNTNHHHARPWLYGIATRLIHGHRRAETRRSRALPQVTISHAEENHDERVVSRIDAELQRARLIAALDSLANRDRDVVLLYAWQELTYDDIAEALNIPVGTVRSRLNRARRKLRIALNELDTTSVVQELKNG